VASGDPKPELFSWTVGPPPPYPGASGIWTRDLYDMHGRQHTCIVTETDEGACAEIYRAKRGVPYTFPDAPAWERCGFKTVYAARQACDRKFQEQMRRQARAWARRGSR